jgi:hypothetical protein
MIAYMLSVMVILSTHVSESSIAYFYIHGHNNILYIGILYLGILYNHLQISMMTS